MKPESYFNRFLPLGGNLGTQQVAAIPISSNPTSIDLRSVFGSLDNGDGLLVKADAFGQPSGWRAYFSLTEKPATINENQSAPGSASGAQCWPLLDGQELLGHLTSGRAVGTGFCTQLIYSTLNVKASSGSGMFRLMRHTLVEPQDASRFQAPIPNLPSMIASGLVGPPSGYLPRP